jgi:hypothetical protein
VDELQYYGPPGNPVFPAGGGGLGTAFAPKHVYVQNNGMPDDGLHLKMAKIDLGGGPVPAGAEAVLMFKPDGSDANLGYGDYLVTAKYRYWPDLDPNAAFGVFTCERLGNGGTGSASNPNRELDLAEISRWGWDHAGTCPFTGNRVLLCKGNAQFALQIWDQDPNNLQRYTLTDGSFSYDTITLVMKWHGANQPVTFQQYYGAFTLDTLPNSPTNAFTSSDSQNRFVPATNCERFHLNLWFGNYEDGPNHPPPRTLPQEVLVTHFEFRPFR